MPELPRCYRCRNQPCECKDGWNAKDIQRAILHFCFMRAVRILVPNIQLLMGGEQDMLEVTAAGYAVEYEIKVSFSDYEADFRKTLGLGHRRGAPTKHAVLAGDIGPGNWTLPRRFWFVMPTPLALDVLKVAPEGERQGSHTLPAHAGLLAATPQRQQYDRGPSLSLTRLKTAPTIKAARKLPSNLRNRVQVSLAARFWDVWQTEWDTARWLGQQKLHEATP